MATINTLRCDRNGGEGDRTPDLVNAIHALSQLSYAPATFLGYPKPHEDTIRQGVGKLPADPGSVKQNPAFAGDLSLFAPLVYGRSRVDE